MNKTLFKRAVKHFKSQSGLAVFLGVTRQFITNVKRCVSPMPAYRLELLKLELSK